jgi:hypothetical protein
VAGSAPKLVGVGCTWTGEAVRGPLTCGPWPHCRVLNWLKLSKSTRTRSNLFHIISNLVHSKKVLPKLKEFEIKYGFKGFEESNNFLHWNFFGFEINFELKI